MQTWLPEKEMHRDSVIGCKSENNKPSSSFVAMLHWLKLHYRQPSTYKSLTSDVKFGTPGSTICSSHPCLVGLTGQLSFKICSCQRWCAKVFSKTHLMLANFKKICVFPCSSKRLLRCELRSCLWKTCDPDVGWLKSFIRAVKSQVN